MNTASLELCKELYELSGWKDTDYVYHAYQKMPTLQYQDDELEPLVQRPAYDLGYLLRKLPRTIDLDKPKVRDLHIVAGGNCWIADYKYRMPWKQQEWMHMYDNAKLTEADTPEDAACKLAIELFKQNILKKEQ